MDEFTERHSIEEWEKSISESYLEQGVALDGEESLPEFLHLTDEQFARMDGYGVVDNDLLNRFIALYRVNQRRFKSFVPGVFGAYILMYGGLTPDEVAGILGVSIDRLSSQDHADDDDPLERMFIEDDKG